MSGAYYNENDPFAAQWLRNLIAAGHIAAGDVDERSIRDVDSLDLIGYRQCHFFAGIGGWSYALRLAGVADDFPVWTGSCPCQPFSSAGKQRGTADPRHLWPEFARLIDERRPSIILGEQVASAAGRLWLAGVRANLEAMDYAVGAADLCAAGVSAPHIRQRLYWVGYADVSHKDERSSSRKQSLRDEDGENFWTSAIAATFEDGKRRLEPGAQSLVDGVPGRLDQLRGFGNAIVPQLAAHFIAATMECIP